MSRQQTCLGETVGCGNTLQPVLISRRPRSAAAGAPRAGAVSSGQRRLIALSIPNPTQVTAHRSHRRRHSQAVAYSQLAQALRTLRTRAPAPHKAARQTISTGLCAGASTAQADSWRRTGWVTQRLCSWNGIGTSNAATHFRLADGVSASASRGHLGGNRARRGHE